MPPAARLGDMHTCPMVTGVVPHVGGPILPPCCPTVIIGMMPAARVGDLCTCVGPPDVIAMGSPTVIIGNMLAARIGDPTVHGGVIVVGCPTVIIGEVGMGKPVIATPEATAASIAAVNTQQEVQGAHAAKAPPRPLPLLKSVSQSEIDLAASEGKSSAKIAARKRVARAFYEEQAKGVDSKFWTNDRINDHLKGIDYSEPVKARISPPPTEVVQWQTPNGSQGTYYADAGAKPTELGIGNYGAEKYQVVEKVAEPYTLQPDTPLLESTAAPMRDTRSVNSSNITPPGQVEPFNIMSQQAEGGGTQYFAPDRSAATTN